MSQASPVSFEGWLTDGRSPPLYQEAPSGVKRSFFIQTPLHAPALAQWETEEPPGRDLGQCHKCPQAHRDAVHNRWHQGCLAHEEAPGTRVSGQSHL